MTSQDRDTQCGVGSFRPKCLQAVSGMLPFSIYNGVLSLTGPALLSFLTSQVTTLERTFGLSSSQSGLLVSMDEFGFLVSVLFTTYFARNSHMPRVLAMCCFLYGLSSLVCVIPQFLKDWSKSSANVSSFGTENNLCVALNDSIAQNETGSRENYIQVSGEIDQQSSVRRVAFAFIAGGMFLQGVTKSPRLALTQTYSDDNSSRTSVGFYLGITSALTVVGPAVGFGIGAAIGNIYVTLEDTDLTPRDPRWIGAWWLGFVIFGLISMILSLPLGLFPKRMARETDEEKEKPPEPTNESFWSKVKDVPRAVLRLITRPVYILLIVSLCFKFFTLSGFMAFAPKYLQLYYGASSYKTNVIMGASTVSSAATGGFLGGIIVSKLRLQLKGSLKLTLFLQILSSAIFFMGIFLVCPQPYVEGLQKRIQPASSRPLRVTSMCNMSCACLDDGYFPVCGSNGVNYYSPCEAGCFSKSLTGGYGDCACVFNSTDNDPISVSSAVPGLCDSECSFLIPYVVIGFLSKFFDGLSMIPGNIIFLRSVEEKDRSFALGFFSFVVSLLGWFLGPIIFGSVIDTTCLLWHTSGTLEGACAVYDITDLRLKIHGLDAIGSLIYILILVAALIYAVFGKSNKLHIAKSEKTETSTL